MSDHIPDRIFNKSIPYRREIECQWRKVVRSKWAKSTCQAGGRIHERAIVRQWHYCPYCGDKIEIVEEDA